MLTAALPFPQVLDSVMCLGPVRDMTVTEAVPASRAPGRRGWSGATQSEPVFTPLWP